VTAESDKRFLVCFALGITVSLIVWVAVLFDTGNDGTYEKLITPRQRSMVLGTSYASRGIVPEILNDAGLPYEGDLYNFAFSNAISRWGTAYSRAVLLKLDPATTNGLFIVQVNPLSFRTLTKAKPDQDSCFFDSLDSVSSNPNLPYLLEHQQETLLQAFTEPRKDSDWVIDPDGWQHHVRDAPANVTLKIIDKNLKVDFPYQLSQSAFSESRWDAFERLVHTLDDHGTVVLVRLPSTDELARLQDAWYPAFDRRMTRFARDAKMTYLNFKGDRSDYRTTDGAHLDSRSAAKFSEELAETLKTLNLWPQ
jgi:hypothetical protein